METILLKNGLILTQNKNREILKGDILIEGNKIKEVGKEINEKADEIFECNDKLIFPGLINAHTHVAMSLFRGYGEGLPLHKWLTKKIWPAERRLTKEAVYWGSMLGMLEMIKSGTTCFNDMYLVGIKEMGEAAKKLGIRGFISEGLFNGVEEKSVEEHIKKGIRSIKEIKELKSELVKPIVSCHSVYSSSEELIRKAKELADKEGLLFHMHASETRKEVFDLMKSKGKRVYEYLQEIGAFDRNTLLAHGAWVSKREILLAKRYGPTIAHCPISSLKLATGGIGPVAEYLQEGVNVTLGTDGPASNNSLNMMETMKMTALLQKHKYWNPTIIKEQDIWDMATLNSAGFFGIESGSIETEKNADIVIADRKNANLVPMHDPRSVIYNINAGNIRNVIINGEWVLKNGEFKKVIPTEVVEKTEEFSKKITENTDGT
ncbi:amidohydrolase [Candidatus Micrarchaeota archaeon]|nr:amidohydrolase [Candidatus Micrarchaeota archaeon]